MTDLVECIVEILWISLVVVWAIDIVNDPTPWHFVLGTALVGARQLFPRKKVLDD